MNIDIIFKCLNFGVLCGLASYLFYKKVLPTLWSLLSQRQDEKKKLWQHVTQLQQEQTDIISQLEEQKHLCQQLRAKVDQWQAVSQENELMYRQQQEAVRADIEDKKRLQARNFSLQTTYRKIKGTVIDQVEDNLKKHYQEPASLDHAHEKIIQFLRNQYDEQ